MSIASALGKSCLIAGLTATILMSTSEGPDLTKRFDSTTRLNVSPYKSKIRSSLIANFT